MSFFKSKKQRESYFVKVEAGKEAALHTLIEPSLLDRDEAIKIAISEIVRIEELVLERVQFSCNALHHNDKKLIHKFIEKEENLTSLESRLSEYIIQLSALALTEQQQQRISNLYYSLFDVMMVDESAQKLMAQAKIKMGIKIRFTKMAQNELDNLMEVVQNMFRYSIKARQEAKIDYIRQVMKCKPDLELIEEIGDKHMERLATGLCNPKSGMLFLNIIHNLVEISNQISQIVEYLKNEIEQ